MPRFIPPAHGTVPAPINQGNDYAAFGNILSALAMGLDRYRTRQQEGRTLGDLAGSPARLPNPAVFNAAPRETVPGVMNNPLQALGFKRPFQAPQPLAVQAPENRFQQLVREGGLGNISMRDLKSMEGNYSALKLLAGSDPEQDLMKQLLLNSQIGRNNAQAAQAQAGAGKATVDAGAKAGAEQQKKEAEARKYAGRIREQAMKSNAMALAGIKPTQEFLDSLDQQEEQAYQRYMRQGSAPQGGGGKGTPPPAGGAERVVVKDKNGKEFTLPRSQLRQALDEGYSLVKKGK